MWELLIDLLELLGIVSLKKRRKKKTELISLETNDSTPEHDTSREVTREGVSVCAGCNRMLEIGAIYELEKAWCTECYKTHVLKVNG